MSVKILFADDEPKVRATVTDILETLGYEVTTAVNGSEALQKLEKQTPDLIISDLEMPVLDGLGFLREIRSRPVLSEVPVLILTGYSEQFFSCIQSGADLYMLKPFMDMKRLSRKIQRILDLHARQAPVDSLQKDLPDIEVDELLSVLRVTKWSGTALVRFKKEKAVFELHSGQLTILTCEGKTDEEAFEHVLEWMPGSYTLEFLPQTVKKTEETETQMETPDLTKPVPIGKDTWWVGYRNPDTMLQMNVYLRVFKSDKGRINYVIDPGAPVDFPEVSQKIGQIIGDISKVGVVSLNHQDPDVCMNTVYIKAANPKLLYICTEDTWRLVYHYDLDPKNVRMVNKFKDFELNLTTGHRIKYLLSPYCHFRGAFLTYDPETQILYTGDLFAGLSLGDRIRNLWADENSWEGMAMFHRIYMPSNKAIKLVIQQIRKLSPKVKMIAPQHGDIIPENQIEFFLSSLEKLEVGVDLLKEETAKEDTRPYVDALNEILEGTYKRIAPEVAAARIQADPVLKTGMTLAGGKVTKLEGTAQVLVERMITAVLADEPVAVSNYIKSLVVKALVMRRLPAVTINWEGNESETVIDQTV